MTREDRKKLTALRKALPVLTRSLIKPYRYKSIDGIIWTAQNDMLFTLDPSIAHPLGEEQFYFKVRCGAKPLFADQLLWDILDLEEAKAALRRLARENYAIVYLTEGYAKDMAPEIARYKDALTPAVILIPGREGSLGIGMDAVKTAVERAVGADIL